MFDDGTIDYDDDDVTVEDALHLADKATLEERRKVIKRLRDIRGAATEYDEMFKMQHEAELQVDNLYYAISMVALRRVADLAASKGYQGVQKQKAAHAVVDDLKSAAALVPYESLTPYPPADVISAVEHTMCFAVEEACTASIALYRAQTSVCDATAAKYDAMDLFEDSLDSNTPVYDFKRIADMYVTSAYVMVRAASESVASAAIALTTSTAASAAATHLGLEFDIKLSTEVLSDSITLLRQCTLVGNQFNRIALAMNHVFEINRLRLRSEKRNESEESSSDSDSSSSSSNSSNV